MGLALVLSHSERLPVSGPLKVGKEPNVVVHVPQHQGPSMHLMGSEFTSLQSSVKSLESHCLELPALPLQGGQDLEEDVVTV